MSDGRSRWRRAALAAALVAADPSGLGGVVVSARAGAVRDAWLDLLARLSPAPIRRVPPGIDDERLMGGLDLAATLSAGRPVEAAGLLSEAAGGLLLVPMAERMPSALSGRLALALDDPGYRLGLVLLAEPVEPGEAAPEALSDRLALHVGLDPLSMRDIDDGDWDREDITRARALLPRVTVPEDAVLAVTRVAAELGIGSLRPAAAALRATRALAALAGRTGASAEDVAEAAALVLAPRARALPQEPEEETPPEHQTPEGERRDREEGALEDRVLDAVRAALPEDLLERLAGGAGAGATGSGAGVLRRSVSHGRPLRSERGMPDGRRLDVIATLHAAAPWQAFRRRERPGRAGLVVTRDDFRVRRYGEPSESVLIFLVDASGSAAAARLAEAKGAVEIMLSQAYRRREKVALIAFRGTDAELLLPPTRSLVQAKRRVAVLPGGGGTPLAAALLAGHRLAAQVIRRGATPVLVLLTDGRGNIALDGQPDRTAAAEEVERAARAIRADGLRGILVDTASRPQPAAEALAGQLGARYLPLPHADAARMNRAVRLAADA